MAWRQYMLNNMLMMTTENISNMEIKDVLEIANKYMTNDDLDRFKQELSEQSNEFKKGIKIFLKDNQGFDKQMDRNKYNGMRVTVDSVYYNADGSVDTFFIEEDNNYYEWALDDVDEL